MNYDLRFRYKCMKCNDHISDKAHEWCMEHHLPDLCFEHQPEYVKKTMMGLGYKSEGVKE